MSFSLLLHFLYFLTINGGFLAREVFVQGVLVRLVFVLEPTSPGPFLRCIFLHQFGMRFCKESSNYTQGSSFFLCKLNIIHFLERTELRLVVQVEC